MPASVPTRPPDRAAGTGLAPLIVLIESDQHSRTEVGELLTEWKLRVSEADLESLAPVQDAHLAAAAIVATYELSAVAGGSQPLTGLDLALLIARRAARTIPTLVLSGDYGRRAIPACCAHHFPVFFKPLVPAHLWGWLRSISLVAMPGMGSGRNAA
jgi:hypothetical protein